MKFSLMTAALAVCALAGTALAETKVEVKGVHLCCPGCTKAVNKAIADSGARSTANQGVKTVFITAADDAAAQKAVDAMAAAGFHGKTDSDKIKMPEAKDVPAGKVKKLEVTGAHNCCGACNNAIKGALKKVAGVTGDTAAANNKDFAIEGDFSAADAIKALYDAGYHVEVKK
jgi:mercuric ion binding protein